MSPRVCSTHWDSALGGSRRLLRASPDVSPLFFSSSILHARLHSSQQVCRHRITGQQLSEHPAADTGRCLGDCLGCFCGKQDGRAGEGFALTWVTGPQVWKLLAPDVPEFSLRSLKNCGSVFPSPFSSHHVTAHWSASVCCLPRVVNR